MKKILLDCGANTGQTKDWFIKNYKDGNEYEIHCFEPNPDLSHHFKDENIIFHQKAVWIKDGEKDFYIKSNILGSSIYKEKTSGGKTIKNEKVKTIDISKFIKENFNKEDYIILKMDIEGAEYKVLDKLLKDKTFKYIDKLVLEFHGAKIQDLYPFFEKMREKNKCDAKTYYMKKLEKLGIEIDIYPYKTFPKF